MNYMSDSFQNQVDILKKAPRYVPLARKILSFLMI